MTNNVHINDLSSAAYSAAKSIHKQGFFKPVYMVFPSANGYMFLKAAPDGTVVLYQENNQLYAGELPDNWNDFIECNLGETDNFTDLAFFLETLGLQVLKEVGIDITYSR